MRKKLLLIIVFLSSTFCYSDVPNEIRYSGRLKNYTSVVNATIGFNFKLYDQESGGTALWESGNQPIKVSNGLFSYLINPDLYRVDLCNSEIWLQLVVDGKELSPREKFTSHLYSLHSLSAENLSAKDKIIIKVGDESISIGVESGKLCYIEGSSTINLSTPAGTIIAFAGNTIPNGHIYCDGRPVSKNDFPDLFNAIGTIYGGAGNPYFNIPDLRNMFLRGTGWNPLGQRQEDAIRNITGWAWARGIESRFNGGHGALFITSVEDNCCEGHNNSRWQGAGINFDASRVVPVANENRPVNCAINYCIKY